jgi:hypothetical protein
MKLEFDWRCTCGACPEQYDIYLFGRPVAYFRLRWGHITVSEYDEYGGLGGRIFEMIYRDSICGSMYFEDGRRIKRRVEQEIIKHWLKQTGEQI